MRNFISKIIQRLRGFVNRGPRDATEETVVGDTIPTVEENMPFSTEAQQSEAWKLLKQHCAELAEPAAFATVDIKTTQDQRASIKDLPLAGREKRPRGRKPSKTALAKAKRTKERNAAASTKVAKRVSKTKRK
ncbi:hypothetical protein JQ631_28625 [Bradyrhizobium manausense]|uniref:hypothetical protein n=1 Tax=Bradyrhizobium manausense TaxID=989370 RepID=UPI001BAD19E3|nr:hypothetical protein [Bradyrhizobium manausense]MBR0793057.1 hypothetical protein [Bradyrhizobium manausense]